MVKDDVKSTCRWKNLLVGLSVAASIDSRTADVAPNQLMLHTLCSYSSFFVISLVGKSATVAISGWLLRCIVNCVCLVLFHLRHIRTKRPVVGIVLLLVGWWGRAWQGTVLRREWLLFWWVSRTVGGAGWLSFIVVLRREVGGARAREGGRFF